MGVVAGLTLHCSCCSLSRSWKVWPSSFPQECSGSLPSPPFFFSGLWAFQSAPTAHPHLTKRPQKTRLNAGPQGVVPLPLPHTHSLTRVYACAHTTHVCTHAPQNAHVLATHANHHTWAHTYYKMHTYTHACIPTCMHTHMHAHVCARTHYTHHKGRQTSHRCPCTHMHTIP